MYEPIENHGIIGDLHTVALVSKRGAIDFMCCPRFDSPTVFAALLDQEQGGHFTICPDIEDLTCRQLYLPNTAILVTRFFSDEGIAELTDFMPVKDREENCAVIRHITAVKGRIRFRVHCAPRFNYGLCRHRLSQEQEGLVFTPEDEKQGALILRSQYPLSICEGDACGVITLDERQTACFMLRTYGYQEEVPASLETYTQACYEATFRYWKQWTGQSLYQGRWDEIVHRSVITLKLLTSVRYGSTVAAPTFGLPEAIGGSRNWDYRYTWIRDAAFTMYVFLQLGFQEEATAFINWIRSRCEAGELQLLYAVDGSVDLTERPLEHLEGYRQSRPVRIGNKAHEQFQLDIYGELIDTVYLYNAKGNGITYEFWRNIEKQINFLCDHWRDPDHGIWEVRSEKREFLHSRMMCWVAVDRGIRIAESRSFPYPVATWQQLRSDIFHDIYEGFWNEDIQAFVQSRGSSELDASVLLMPLMRIVSPEEPRWLKTLAAIEEHLKSDVLIHRYLNGGLHTDGIDGPEGTFSICSFWYVECLAKSGQIDKAMEHFEKLVGYANHLGLFSEQLGHRGEHLGNFPQAFTHLALISAALSLDKYLDRRG